MKPITDYPETELKLVYRILQSQLQSYPDLLDSEMLEALQRHLQTSAREDGIDPTYHPAWAAWLRNEPAPTVPTGPSLKLVED